MHTSPLSFPEKSGASGIAEFRGQATQSPNINSDGKTHAFLLSKGVFTTIDFPGAILTTANGINSRGVHGSGGDFNIQAPNPGQQILSRYRLTGRAPA